MDGKFLTRVFRSGEAIDNHCASSTKLPIIQYNGSTRGMTKCIVRPKPRERATAFLDSVTYIEQNLPGCKEALKVLLDYVRPIYNDVEEFCIAQFALNFFNKEETRERYAEYGLSCQFFLAICRARAIIHEARKKGFVFDSHFEGLQLSMKERLNLEKITYSMTMEELDLLLPPEHRTICNSCLWQSNAGSSEALPLFSKKKSTFRQQSLEKELICIFNRLTTDFVNDINLQDTVNRLASEAPEIFLCKVWRESSFQPENIPTLGKVLHSISSICRFWECSALPLPNGRIPQEQAPLIVKTLLSVITEQCNHEKNEGNLEDKLNNICALVKHLMLKPESNRTASRSICISNLFTLLLPSDLIKYTVIPLLQSINNLKNIQSGIVLLSAAIPTHLATTSTVEENGIPISVICDVFKEVVMIAIKINNSFNIVTECTKLIENNYFCNELWTILDSLVCLISMRLFAILERGGIILSQEFYDTVDISKGNIEDNQSSTCPPFLFHGQLRRDMEDVCVTLSSTLNILSIPEHSVTRIQCVRLLKTISIYNCYCNAFTMPILPNVPEIPSLPLLLRISDILDIQLECKNNVTFSDETKKIPLFPSIHLFMEMLQWSQLSDYHVRQASTWNRLRDLKAFIDMSIHNFSKENMSSVFVRRNRKLSTSNRCKFYTKTDRFRHIVIAGCALFFTSQKASHCGIMRILNVLIPAMIYTECLRQNCDIFPISVNGNKTSIESDINQIAGVKYSLPIIFPPTGKIAFGKLLILLRILILMDTMCMETFTLGKDKLAQFSRSIICCVSEFISDCNCIVAAIEKNENVVHRVNDIECPKLEIIAKVLALCIQMLHHFSLKNKGVMCESGEFEPSYRSRVIEQLNILCLTVLRVFSSTFISTKTRLCSTDCIDGKDENNSAVNFERMQQKCESRMNLLVKKLKKSTCLLPIHIGRTIIRSLEGLRITEITVNN